MLMKWLLNWPSCKNQITSKDNNYIIITGVFLTEEEAKNMGNDISANGITCVIKQEKFTSDFKEKIEQQDYEAIIKELGSWNLAIIL